MYSNTIPPTPFPKFDFCIQAEVDALIDMVSQLKEERDKYKFKYRQLCDSINRNTTPVTPVAPLLTSPAALSHMLLSGKVGTLPHMLWNNKPSPGANLINKTSPGTLSHIVNNKASPGALQNILLSRKASTASTYLSSRATTPGDCVTNGLTTPSTDLLWRGNLTPQVHSAALHGHTVTPQVM